MQPNSKFGQIDGRLCSTLTVVIFSPERSGTAQNPDAEGQAAECLLGAVAGSNCAADDVRCKGMQMGL